MDRVGTENEFLIRATEIKSRPILLRAKKFKLNIRFHEIEWFMFDLILKNQSKRLKVIEI